MFGKTCLLCGVLIALVNFAANATAQELVSRERVRLNLAGAELILAAAKSQAA